MFSVRLPKDLIKELKLEAVNNDTTAQLIVEKALKEYFAKKIKLESRRFYEKGKW